MTTIFRQPRVGDFVEIVYGGTTFMTKITKIDNLVLYLFDEKNNNPNVSLTWSGPLDGWMLTPTIKPTSVQFIFPPTENTILPIVNLSSSSSSSASLASGSNTPKSPSINYHSLSLVMAPTPSSSIITPLLIQPTPIAPTIQAAPAISSVSPLSLLPPLPPLNQLQNQIQPIQLQPISLLSPNQPQLQVHGQNSFLQPITMQNETPLQFQPIQTLQQLQQPVQQQVKKVVKFFSGKDSFSNFFELKTPLVYNGLTFPTSEHLYQWAKFQYPGASPATTYYAEFVRTASTANKAKIIANQRLEPERYQWQKDLNVIIRNGIAQGAQINPNWENVKIDIMRFVLALKFNDPELKQRLLATGDALIQENSPYDSYYGIGKDGNGQNILGKLLMELRDKLK